MLSNTRLIYSKPILLLLICIFGLHACSTDERPHSIPEVESIPLTLPNKLPSAQAIESPSQLDILFAQASLKALGYDIGEVDGFWGERSSIALLKFEQDKNLESAGGQLSELNLFTLKELAQTLKPVSKKTSKTKPKSSLAEKVKQSISQSKGPQLIIIEQNYPLMSKANPYSRVITQLNAGAAIYVISFQDGWYEVESLSKEYGFIKDN